MSKLNPYLNFAGNAEEAFDFYKSIFGGEYSSIVKFKDISVHGHPGGGRPDLQRPVGGSRHRDADCRSDVGGLLRQP